MSKGNDINIGSIEEAIKRCKELIKPEHSNWIGLTNQSAIEIVLGNLEALCDMQKSADRENKKLKERVKELEEERQIVGMPVKNKRSGNIGIVLHQWEGGSIAVLENINPRVINTHDSWNTLEIITDEIKQVQTKNNSISKQNIKDKIKELKEDKESKYYDSFLEERDIEITVQILEELLQEEDK